MASNSTPNEAPPARISNGLSKGVQEQVTSVPDTNSIDEQTHQDSAEVKRLRFRTDLRLCTIAGLLCSLNLLDGGIISIAAVTSMPEDLGLTGDRFSVAIFIFAVSSIIFQLPSTILVRIIGPRIFFASVVFGFGLITACTAAITNWRQMIVLRVLLGATMSGVFPGLTYLVSTYYTRKEQQLRFALLQTGEIIVLATGGILSFALNKLDHRSGLRGWQWVYAVQGSITMFLGLLTYFWMIDFPEKAHQSFHFMTLQESAIIVERINADRQDGLPTEALSFKAVAINFLDPKLYAFCLLFYLLNIVSTALSYFTPIILQNGMGYSSDSAILLSTPPYYYSVIPVLLTSYIGDKYGIRGPIIILNALCLIIGFSMLGFLEQSAARYTGIFVATGAYISNWAALNAYQANNIAGQWKRATFAAAVTSCNGLGGITGSYIVRSKEAPRYLTAIRVAIGSQALMILLVGCCSIAFWIANKKQRKGKNNIEGVVGFRYTI